MSVLSLDKTVPWEEAIEIAGEESTLNQLVEEGLWTIQFIDGKKYIRVTDKNSSVLAETFKSKPISSCVFIWNRLMKDYHEIDDLIMMLMKVHHFIKDVTNSSVDFLDTVYKETENQWK
jgi:hypothetical protein